MTICVVHLAWAGAGIPALERFLRSYRTRAAGAEHSLVIAWKGYEQRDDALAEARARVGDVDHLEMTAPPHGLDLSAYRWLAEHLHETWLCFLNSSAEILADSWLEHLAHALDAPGVGIVGATGSYESARSAAPRPLRPLRRGFAPFPNPHVRTNAFMMRREGLLALDWPATDSKLAAEALESGRRGITAQILGRGEAAVVVGRGGDAFEPARWPASGTFRSGGQENLLIADNRTRDYDAADRRQRLRLSRMAWGDPAGSAT